MVALFILLSTVAVSMILVRVATQALVLTGLSKEVADFQARSVLTGTGYTTDEAEKMVAHPVRRRIVMLLMLLQNAGLVTVISTFILSFVGTGSTAEVLQRGVLLVAGLGVLALLARSKLVGQGLELVIGWALDRFTDLQVRDYYTLLDLEGNHVLLRMRVDEASWLAGKSLDELDLPHEGVMVLSIHRADGSTRYTPRGRYTVRAGDVLTLYGEAGGFEELRERRRGEAGDAARRAAERRHEERMRRQDAEEAAYDAASPAPETQH